MEIIRATKTAEQAGAYYVRIQAMARKHQIPLNVEFDEHDTPETKYIVVIDNYLPIATCRLYAINEEQVMLGRIVVLPEYRLQGLGTLVVKEAEKWAKELGYHTISTRQWAMFLTIPKRLSEKHLLVLEWKKNYKYQSIIKRG